MIENRRGTAVEWSDSDDAPEWTDAMFDAAQFSDGNPGKRPTSNAKPVGTSVEHRRSMPREISSGVFAMAKDKVTSPKAAKAASKTLRDGRTAKDSKTAAGSALSQKEKKSK